jgi:hypothetical protein
MFQQGHGCWQRGHEKPRNEFPFCDQPHDTVVKVYYGDPMNSPEVMVEMAGHRRVWVMDEENVWKEAVYA